MSSVTGATPIEIGLERLLRSITHFSLCLGLIRQTPRDDIYYPAQRIVAEFGGARATHNCDAFDVLLGHLIPKHIAKKGPDWPGSPSTSTSVRVPYPPGPRPRMEMLGMIGKNRIAVG